MPCSEAIISTNHEPQKKLKIIYQYGTKKCKKKSLPRGIEPRSPALIGINDKRKSSPLDQGRCDGRVTARPLGWLMEDVAGCGFITENKSDLHGSLSDTSFSNLDDPVFRRSE
ncbi:hypothetical protein N7455_011387 [Penicillium solitum]|uniref:uncharacterized protein n=1 Tax=Penicillium solitum TaxID=60172 RepID=UPI0032C489C6|nr:hypothetical protein N7455_011387 [Penicillium solitum]